MRAAIVKWGNSHGIRIPKYVLESVNLTGGETVDIITENNSIVIKKAESGRAHKTFKERMAGFKGEYVFEEWDTGESVGGEVINDDYV